MGLAFQLAVAMLAGVPAQVPLVFSHEGTFVVVSRSGELLERRTDFCGRKPAELAVSADLRWYAMTSYDEAAQNPILYVCEKGASARLVGSDRGYHAQPTFDASSKRIYFVHHPVSGGPPGQHEEGANAQLFVAGLRGRPTQLTDDKGCKLAPRAVGRDSVIFLHDTCDGSRSLEKVSPTGRTTVLPVGRLPNFPDLSADGRRLVFVEQLYDDTRIVVREISSGAERVLVHLAPLRTHARASWSADGRTVFYQDQGWVWRVSAGGESQSEKLFSITGVDQ